MTMNTTDPFDLEALRGIVLGLAIFLAGCTNTPTDTYNCSPGCFVDCTAEHMSGAEKWTHEEAIETAKYCHAMKNECVTCIERIERDGNACGFTRSCEAEGVSHD